MSEEEQMIIEAIPGKFKYIARDKDGSLYAYSEMPLKNYEQGKWYLKDRGGDLDLFLFNDLFKSIKFSDILPYRIGRE